MESNPQIATALAELERAQMGGRRRRTVSASKPKKTSSTSSSKPKKTSKKSGGAIMDDIKSLAVPFAILLAKQGLQTMFEKDKPTKVGVASDSPSSKKKSPKKQTGGTCATCQQPAMSGGKKAENKKTNKLNDQQRGESVKKSYASLAKRIDEFLSKY